MSASRAVRSPDRVARAPAPVFDPLDRVARAPAPAAFDPLDRAVTAPARAEGGLLDRAAGWFVVPAGSGPVAEPAASLPRFAPRALVLGTAADGPPVAAALACALRARERTAAAVVAAWRPEAAAQISARPATLAARRLSARLADRALPAAPRGRLAWLELPAEAEHAVTLARRAAGAVDVPLVTAVAGPRSSALDALLAQQDLVVVATPEPEGPLARLALAELAAHPASVVACAPLPAGAPRTLALAGLAGPRLVDERLRAALRNWP